MTGYTYVHQLSDAWSMILRVQSGAAALPSLLKQHVCARTGHLHDCRLVGAALAFARQRQQICAGCMKRLKFMARLHFTQ